MSSPVMTNLSRSEIIRSHPIGNRLDDFRSSYTLRWKDKVESNFDREDLRQILLALFPILQTLDVIQVLPSQRGKDYVLNDLSALYQLIVSDSFVTAHVRPLLDAVVNSEPDEVIWDKVGYALAESNPPARPASSTPQTPSRYSTGYFANSTDYRKYFDDMLKEELGNLYVGIPGFFEAFFGEGTGLSPAAHAVFDKCKEGESPLYREDSGWQGWPAEAKESDVLSWFARLTDQLQDFVEEHQPASGTRRRPLAQPHQSLQGSTAARKLDIGFVEDPNAGADSKCRWSQILVPGELKSNPLADKASQAWLDLGRYTREIFAAQDSRRFVLGFTLCGSLMRVWEFDRLGGIASKQFDINEDGLQFVTIVLGFLLLTEEQLGFDPSIVTAEDKRYIEIERDGRKVRLVVDQVIQRVPCIAGRATTCWRVYREDEPNTPLVVKDSWQYPEREEEGVLLREATEKGVVNVARYFHHQTVQVGEHDDDILSNVRKGLDVTKAMNYKPEKKVPPPSTTRHRVSRRDDGSSSLPGQKRSSSCTGVLLPPSKRSCSSPPTKPVILNRVHRRVIVRDYGKPIYKASSPASLLSALEGCIEGYQSLHTRVGLVQRDISPNNLLLNEDAKNPSWPSFLIDLDLAVKEQREKPSGARSKTGTRAFIAIGVLLDDEQHSYMHDLESFFWVLFWICIHYDGPGKGIGTTEFECWNYEGSKKLAELKKGLISDERDFLQTMQTNFTSFYRVLAPHVNRLRRKVFPGGGRWRDPNPQLYHDMKQILRSAQNELKELEE